MKSLLKLGLLFAIIVAGRYMQTVDPTVAGMPSKPKTLLFTPANLNLAPYSSYAEANPAQVITVSQGKRPAPTWY